MLTRKSAIGDNTIFCTGALHNNSQLLLPFRLSLNSDVVTMNISGWNMTNGAIENISNESIRGYNVGVTKYHVLGITATLATISEDPTTGDIVINTPSE